MNNRFDVIVIGGGAAGLMAASSASKRGLKTALIEGNKNLGKKILISGGGRCNFTNLFATPNNFKSSNIHFHKSALKRYSPYDFLDLVEKYKVSYVEKAAGQLFCKVSAREIVNLLEKECLSGGVEIFLNCKAHSISKNEEFSILTTLGEFTARNLIIATGGLPIPTIGGTDFGLKIAKSFGHKIVEPSPALVPFKLNESLLKKTKALSGLSLKVKISNDEISFLEDILFTHKGLSGPGILQISLYWNPGESISIDLLPELEIEDILRFKKRHPKKSFDSYLKMSLPKKFVEFWCQFQEISLSMNFADYTNEELVKIMTNVKCFSVKPVGTEGYRKAEVMKGGVSTDEVSSKSMESRLVKGLYFIGEVMDVTGELGGFNFQWAWASGNAAGQSVI
ncbi:hypothetical protein A9Q84_04835 [Halobacteriovorax marinus]|uniref:Aminoacetone oxidase family FAD-binding enzyme n=1 Tax=Halobacteriovorax marinus TaxID=97084 RepID=A0A1Y5FGB4_9BACT|nr:hypothetical protein A9Q84_04835 [Halobacteriovorax marinus]